MTDQNFENQERQGESTPSQEQPNLSKTDATQSGQPNYQEQVHNQGQPYYQGQPNYGQQGGLGNAPQQEKPENNMTMSIIATVLGFVCCSFCCIGGILGVIAIVFSSQTDSKYNMGDIDGALNSAKTAKTLAIISLVLTGISLISSIIYYAFIFFTIGTEGFMEQYMEALEQLQ